MNPLLSKFDEYKSILKYKFVYELSKQGSVRDLLNDYDVDSIIRIGTAGSYTTDFKIFDILVADSAYSKTDFDEEAGREDIKIINSSFELNSAIMDTAALKRINARLGRVHTTEAFYTENKDYSKFIEMGCKAVEMECYALFYNAKKFLKKATAILTISDNLITHEEIDAKEREQKLDDMIFLALESIIKE